MSDVAIAFAIGALAGIPVAATLNWIAIYLKEMRR